MGTSSSKPSAITLRPKSPSTTAAPTDPPAEDAAAAENAEEDDDSMSIIILPPRWVRDRETGEEWIEKNRRKDEMLERRGEITHVLRQQGKRFFTRHKDGTMQMDPKRVVHGEFLKVMVRRLLMMHGWFR